MFNIKFKGKYTNEDQLTKAELSSDAVMFKEPNSFMGLFLLGGLISLPIIVITLIGLIWRSNSISLKVMLASSIVCMILSYVHEFIHAIWIDL